MNRTHVYRAGTPVICRVCKYGTSPSPKAEQVRPERGGEGYHYEVTKFWTVRQVSESTVVVATRRGKTHTVPIDDPSLRAARWWERLIYRRRFPSLTASTAWAAV